MNQLETQQAGGALVFKGTVSEPATVTVGGTPANVTTDNRFEGQADVPEGTGQVDIVATDPSGNVRTSTYEVSQAGSPKTFTYDLNGNMTSDGTRTYEWDAENRLVAVKEGASTVASFTYNSANVRASKTTPTGTATYLLEENSVVEDRLGGSVTKHFQGPGVDNVLAIQGGTGVTYLTRDHLGSIREHVDPAGTVTLRRDYDPWGQPISAGSAEGWGFTGREWEPELDLYYYRARYYGPGVGRFLTEDPIGKQGNGSLYRYVGNSPIRFGDPSGLYRCVYYIADRYLQCFPDFAGNRSFAASDASSGRNSPACTDCQNNPDRTNVEDHGPAPQGFYRIERAHYSGNRWRRNLTPDQGGRTDIQLHGCLVPTAPGCSSGCIALPNDSFAELDFLLSLEEGHNTLEVYSTGTYSGPPPSANRNPGSRR